MMNYYHTSYNDHTALKINLRRLILLGAVICDFFAFYTIADIIISGPIYLLQMFALFILSSLIRIYSINILHTYDYVYDGEKLTVSKSNSYKLKNIIVIKKGYSLEFCDELHEKVNVIDLAGKSKRKSIIKLSGRYYAMALDDYMTAAIKNIIDSQTEEEK